MGYWLWTYFKGLKNFDSDAQTEQFDLPKKGIISNITLEIQATAGSANTALNLADAISKVEIIGNGSTVIQSLTGHQIQASQAIDDGQMPGDKELSPSGTCFAYFDIRFGRYPGDQKYALDLSRWESVQVKITYALAAGGTIDTTGFTASSGKLAMYGLYSPDGAGLTPAGYIKKEQKYTRTSVASAEWPLLLPTDYPFRRILLRDGLQGGWPYRGFQYVTITINNGARKPIDNMLGNDLLVFDQNIHRNPIYVHWKRNYFASGHNDYYPPIHWMQGASTGVIVGGQTVFITGLDPNWMRVTTNGATSAEIVTRGFVPHGCMSIDLERQSGKDGVEAMMDAWGFDQEAAIELKWTEQEASHTLSIVLEQYATK